MAISDLLAASIHYLWTFVMHSRSVVCMTGHYNFYVCMYVCMYICIDLVLHEPLNDIPKPTIFEFKAPYIQIIICSQN